MGPAVHDAIATYYANNRRAYAEAARWYDVGMRPFRALRREVARLAGAEPGVRMLDVATGTGEQALAFGADGAEVVGVDISEEMLAVARRKNAPPGVSFRQADATALPFEAERFDVVSISLALHEMPAAIRAGALREMRRVVQPEGRLVIVDYGLPRGRFWRWIVVRLVRLFEKREYTDFVRSDLGEQLRRAGFRLDDERPRMLGVLRIVRASCLPCSKTTA